MFNRCYVLIILSLISGVLGIINIDNSNEVETKCRLVDLEVKIKKMESDTLYRFITYIDGKIDALTISNRKLQENLENKIKQEINASNKKGEDNFLNITQTLNALSKKIEEKFMSTAQTYNELNKTLEENLSSIVQTYNALNKTVEEILEKKIKQEVNASNKKEEINLLNITQASNALSKKIDHNLEEKIAQTSNTPGTMKEILEKNQTSAQLSCKEKSLTGYSAADRISPHYSMDNETLNHVTVKRDSAGLLTYFEMHVAIQADGHVNIMLYDTKHWWKTYIQYNLRLGWGSHDDTQLDKWAIDEHIPTPDILSSTEFRTFYIIVDNGTLQFGKEGDSSPLVTHYDARLRSLKYFRVYYQGHNNAVIRYDCPVPVPERS